MSKNDNKNSSTGKKDRDALLLLPSHHNLPSASGRGPAVAFLPQLAIHAAVAAVAAAAAAAAALAPPPERVPPWAALPP